MRLPPQGAFHSGAVKQRPANTRNQRNALLLVNASYNILVIHVAVAFISLGAEKLPAAAATKPMANRDVILISSIFNFFSSVKLKIKQTGEREGGREAPMGVFGE